MYDDLLSKVEKIHFVGIGGSGMCPMAEVLANRGYQISGSDTYKSDTLERILATDIKIFFEHTSENINGVDLVVYSAAIKNNNPEIIAANNKGIPVIERSVMLGLLVEEYKKSIAVSGTHGKTTTTAMITQIFLDSGKEPSAIIGGKLNKLGSNSCVGKSEIMVCEACEYVDSFLRLYPFISVILNVDSDHLDYFKTFDNVKRSFSKFAKQTKDTIVYNGDDIDCEECVSFLSQKKISFGLKVGNTYRATDIHTKDNSVCKTFSVEYRQKKIADITLAVPGEYNLMNALAAFAVAHYMGVSSEDIVQSLNNFTGVHRRFEILDNINNIMLADDFAHHPTELRAVLNCAMNMGFKRVWAVFQPHTFSRTAAFLDEFADALSIPDKVILSEILPVREINTQGIHSRDLASKIPGSIYLKTFEEITDYIVRNTNSGDLVLTLGGGNVYKCAHMILNALKK